MLDEDRCYAAVQSRDSRFDGWFVTAVRTTGIYCRPSCPAITPRRPNVCFYPAAATAQQHGFRACKRCRPDAAPGSPEWNVRQDVVGRAMRLIGDGVVDRDGVPGLARRLGYSERHLNRLMTEELGAGPLAIARAQRAHTARVLIETTDLRLTDVAFAAGFGSIRQFNDTIQRVFAASPSALRAGAVGSTVPGAGLVGRDGRADAGRRFRRMDAAMPPAGTTGSGPSPGTVDLRLPARTPFAGREVLAFLGRRAIPGVEHWDGVTYRRTLRLPAGAGTVELRAEPAHVVARLRLTEWSDLGAAVQRIRRLLDLDADPLAVDRALAADPGLADLVAATPGRRAPGAAEPFELLVRAVVGQQVSVAGARTVAARLVEHHGEPLPVDDDRLTWLFPTPGALAAADTDAWPMPTARAATIRRLSEAVATAEVAMDPGADPADLRHRLLGVRGVGPWTADYVVMRALGHPDIFLPTDRGVVRALAARGLDSGRAAAWAPWRSYAVHHLWAAEPSIEEVS
jgi:AraC family transcriptional regulator, regulatory protein of adaptative response / DNA-3-methyladenine glycosylase II